MKPALGAARKTELSGSLFNGTAIQLNSQLKGFGSDGVLFPTSAFRAAKKLDK